MANATVTQMPVKTPTPFMRDCAVIRDGLPILTLVLLVARRARTRPQVHDGASVLLEGWAALADQIVKAMDVSTPELLAARQTASRAIRISQGYESAARDRAYQRLVEYIEGLRGLDRELSDEECVALNNGMLDAFAGYFGFLDHTAGAIAGGVQ